MDLHGLGCLSMCISTVHVAVYPCACSCVSKCMCIYVQLPRTCAKSAWPQFPLPSLDYWQSLLIHPVTKLVPKNIPHRSLPPPSITWPPTFPSVPCKKKQQSCSNPVYPPTPILDGNETAPSKSPLPPPNLRWPLTSHSSPCDETDNEIASPPSHFLAPNLR